MTTINTFTGNQSTLGLSKRYINKFEALNFKLSHKFPNIFLKYLKNENLYNLPRGKNIFVFHLIIKWN